MSHRAAVVATGIASCVGAGVENAFKYLLDDRSLFKRQDIFPSPLHSDAIFAVADTQSMPFSKSPRCERLVLTALKEALSKFDISTINPKRIGVFAGTSVGNVLECEDALAEIIAGNPNPHYRAFSKYECSSISDAAARFAGAKGIRFSVSTACSSAGLAAASAAEALALGKLDAAIVCGADTLSRITINGFSSLRLLSKGACKPFDANRDGINLGEIGCAAILVSGDIAKRSKCESAIYLSAYSSTSDAYHPTAPHPEAEGVVRSILRTLNAAEKSPSDIDYYNAHGTATPANDAAESVAIKNIFGAQTYVAFSSFKGKFAHTLGASGLLNMILTAESMKRNVLPRNFGFSEKDESIGIEPLRRNIEKHAENALALSIGFGGNNSCLMLSADEQKSEKRISQRKEFYISTFGIVCGDCADSENPVDNPIKSHICKIENLLKTIPPLKKRKWAKLQQMAVSAAADALSKYEGKLDPPETCVCFGTGLGMTEQTQKFVANAIEKREAEPMPTAFTNSVHNAISSAVGTHFGFKGLNTAVSAKEASFECAMWTAMTEIESDAAKTAIVGSCDEYNELFADFFAKAASFANADFPFSDLAAAYVVSENPQNAFAKIIALEISDSERSPDKEAAAISLILSNAGIEAEEIRETLVPFAYNRFQKNFILKTARLSGLEQPIFTEEEFGLNYSLSAFAPIIAARRGAGKYLGYTKTSAGQSAFLIFEIL